MKTNFLACITVLIALAGCASSQPVAQCDVSLQAPLSGAMYTVEQKLVEGCEYGFDHYLSQLIDVAVDDPSPKHKRTFSDFLVRVSNQGIISKRQASAIYNRYFNVKFVSLAGDYNTCSQVCPVRSKVLADMRGELLDKEVGLMQASRDASSYYRADHLLKESQIVLEATCRACGENTGRDF